MKGEEREKSLVIEMSGQRVLDVPYACKEIARRRASVHAGEVIGKPVGVPHDRATRPGLGWLNVLVFLFFWNAMKFAWMAVLSLPLMLGRVVTRLVSGTPVATPSQ